MLKKASWDTKDCEYFDIRSVPVIQSIGLKFHWNRIYSEENRNLSVRCVWWADVEDETRYCTAAILHCGLFTSVKLSLIVLKLFFMIQKDREMRSCPAVWGWMVTTDCIWQLDWASGTSLRGTRDFRLQMKSIQLPFCHNVDVATLEPELVSKH